MNTEFIRVRSTKDITISSVLTLSGCVLVALPTSTSINIAGFFMIFAGLILFLTMRTGYKEITSGKSFCKKEIYFAQSLRNEVADAISGKPASINLSEEDKGNGIRLDIYHSKKDGKAYLQLFEYIPYKYEPCSKVYEYEYVTIENLVK